MSKDQTTARDYVKSYINGTNTDEILQKEQPQFDPKKSVPSPQITPVEKEQDNSASIEATNHLNIHFPTQNPIPAQEEPKQEQPKSTLTPEQQAQWTSRGVKAQRAEIQETALTNCADLNEDLMNCFNHGSWWDKAKLCEDQKQKFWNCFNSQKKFLKEVNYKGPMNTEKDDDNILLAAYKLRDKLDKQSKKEN